MSFQPELHSYPHQRPDESPMSLADWTEAVAVGAMLFTAAVLIATLIALLIVV